MGKFASVFGAATLALSFAVGSVAPTIAAPIVSPISPTQSSSDIIRVQGLAGHNVNDSNRHVRRWDRNPDWRGGERWRGGGGDWRGGDWRRGDGWYRGHRGYRHWRHGYRRHNGWWYPAGAFVAGAIIGSSMYGPRYVEPRRYRGASNAHVRWCYNRYRSYRAWDNTFQPYNGPRRECHSPYSY